MKKPKNKVLIFTYVGCIGLGVLGDAYSMGLRSFVALPVDKDGMVIRLSLEHAEDADTDTLTSSAAYGISARQTL